MREHPVNSSLRNFFSIDVCGAYFPGGSSGNVEIIPSADTIFLFRGMNVRWQHSDHHYLAQLHTGLSDQDCVHPPKEKQWRTIYGHQVLRFYVRLKEEGLYGHSDARPSPGRKFYFSNLQGLRENSSLVSGTTIPGMPQIEEIPYSTGTCSFVLAPGSGITKTDVRFDAFNYDADAPGFTIPSGMPANLEFSHPREKIDLALFSLHPGIYRISLNDITKTLYYDPVLAREDFVGVLELYLHLPASHENALLEDDGRIREQHFTLFIPGEKTSGKLNPDHPEPGQVPGKNFHLPETRGTVVKKLWTRKDKTG